MEVCLKKKKANTDKENDKRFKETDKLWTAYEDAKERNMQSLDKVVVAISSALFGLLLAIFDKNLLDKSPILPILFKILIISNATTIIFVLISYYTANKSMDIKKQDALYETCKLDCYECATKFLNCGYLTTTCITILILATIMWQIF